MKHKSIPLVVLAAVLTLLLTPVHIGAQPASEPSSMPLLAAPLPYPGPASSTGDLPDSRAVDAASYYVDAVSGSDTSGDGSMGTPWRTITHALSQVNGPEVEIYVASGLYNEALGESFPITMEPGVSLIGADRTTTIVSGNGVDDVFHFPDTVAYAETTIISGFKITNGANGVRVNGPTGDDSSPTIQGNWITGNNQGIYNRAESGGQVYTVIRDNLISENASYGISNSAGLTDSYVDPTIEDNQIVDNGDVGIWCFAADSSCSPVISRNYIAENHNDGITCKTYHDGDCSPVLTANTIAQNQGWGMGRRYGGTYAALCMPMFINNLVVGNTSGGALFESYDTPTFINNTIADNNGYGIRDGVPTILNTVVWGHADDLDVSVDHVSYSDIGDGGYDGVNHNISADR